MAHALQIHPHESIDELRRVVRTSDDEAQKTRIRAIIVLREGAPRREVARHTVVDSDTITNWIKAYNRGGVAALKMSRGGRPGGNPKWDPRSSRLSRGRSTKASATGRCPAWSRGSESATAKRFRRVPSGTTSDILTTRTSRRGPTPPRVIRRSTRRSKRGAQRRPRAAEGRSGALLLR